MYWVLHHIYDDLKAAIKLLHANPWVPLVIASASGLAHDSKDYPVELTEDLTRVAPLQSYASLDKVMIAMGDEADRWTSKYVAMRVNDGKPVGWNRLALLRYLLPNLLASLCPPLWVLAGSSSDLMTSLEAYSQAFLLCCYRRLRMASRTMPRQICTVLAALDTRWRPSSQ
jgi:hypothetical protein